MDGIAGDCKRELEKPSATANQIDALSVGLIPGEIESGLATASWTQHGCILPCLALSRLAKPCQATP
jgi:hypothetical protein